jgi:predicted PurR-regulated permease PerM
MRATLVILIIVALIGTCLWIVHPFLPATIWAATLVVATWPVMRRLQVLLWDSRALATTVMIIVLLLLFVVPFWLAIGTIVANSGQILNWADSVSSVSLPHSPAWLGDIPVIGPPLVLAWDRIADEGTRDLVGKVRPYAGKLTQWFVAAVGSFGIVVVQFLLTVGIAAVLYAQGERAAAMMTALGVRLAGSRGGASVLLAGQAIRGVALGVVVTALVQSAISTLALLIAGVPYASILSAILFMLCIAQIGPGLVLIPAIIWMYASGETTSATILLVCSIPAIAADNFLRPILIRKGVDLPLLLILAGVVGGLIAFGLIGIFLGPTVLAVAFRLMEAWVAEGVDAAATEARGAA